jgi:hypothetical protein
MRTEVVPQGRATNYWVDAGGEGLPAMNSGPHNDSMTLIVCQPDKRPRMKLSRLHARCNDKNDLHRGLRRRGLNHRAHDSQNEPSHESHDRCPGRY